METSKVLRKILLSRILVADSELYHEIQHGNFGRGGLFQSTRSIAANTLGNELNVLVIVEIVAPVVRGVINFDGEFPTGPNVCHCHFIHGQSTSFVRTYIIGTSHDFTRGKSLDEVLINKHALN